MCRPIPLRVAARNRARVERIIRLLKRLLAGGITGVKDGQKKLVIVGGAEDKEGDCAILKEFVSLAGGGKARLVVMTVATNEPEEAAEEYKRVFKRLGVDDVRAVDVSKRRDTESGEALAALDEATGIYFTGGDQLHVPSLLGGSGMQDLLRERHEAGTVIGGTSAGATMMSNSMILGGVSNANPRFGSINIGPGMDFVPGTMIDTHFSQRGRHGRLLAAVAHYPQDIGIGIDENTAILFGGAEFEVLGENCVTVIDAGAITYTSLPDIREGESLTLHNVRVHVLAAGHRFDLERRLPIEEAEDGARAKPAKHKTAGKASKT
jgi:cyanophycinase